ncbi:Protein of unknown function DUF4506 [Cinara cedri]|uniref:Uncharacterized protein n=1 Tax=Cinara cedri TaxID=506608 RepID=A0A5E4N6T4_9HEMI|nr:Protein of unknown function DUF4506 [Cinara cedri]
MNESIDYKKFIKVKYNWQSNVDGMDIENIVVARLQQFEDKTAEIDFLSLIEGSDCVNFTKPLDQNNLFININCDPKYLISKIILSSEAKIIELFGKTGEYISTHLMLSSNDINEFPINSHSIKVNSTECSLKFEQLKYPDFIWIYGIIIYLIETKEHSNKSLGPINMQNVQNLLNPDLLVTNASKLLTALSLKKSKSDSDDFLNSILNKFENAKLSNSENDKLLNSFKQFETRVEDKFNNMALQINTIGKNIEMLNSKFDTLLNILHEKKIL